MLFTNLFFYKGSGGRFRDDNMIVKNDDGESFGKNDVKKNGSEE